MSEARNKLLKRAQQYKSREEFRDKDMPGYLLAQRKRVLQIAFPPVVANTDRPGIAMCYQSKKLVYITMADQNIDQILEDYLEITTNNITAYKIYYIDSKADTRVAYHYLVGKYKPAYNNDCNADLLTIHIPDLHKAIGQPIEYTLQG